MVRYVPLQVLGERVGDSLAIGRPAEDFEKDSWRVGGANRLMRSSDVHY